MTSSTHTYDLESGSEWRREGSGGHGSDGERLARALGVFSVGLGLAQILAPHGVTRAIGIEDDDDNRKTMRAVGFRELATGVGLLTQQRPAPFAWGRVTGDAMDLAMLGRAYGNRRNDQRRLAAAAAAVAGVTILDIIASQRLSRAGNGSGITARERQGIQVEKSLTINRSVEEVYGFWRDLENLPRFMAHLESVRELDARRSYWKARAPLGTTVEWTAEIVEDRPNQLISWRSMEGSQVPNSGTVRFVAAPGDRGTEVHLHINYSPPAGVVGAAIAKLFGEEPSQQVDGDLRRLKQVLETGEVVHSDASIHRGPHPARPPEQVPDVAAGGATDTFGSRTGGLE